MVRNDSYLFTIYNYLLLIYLHKMIYAPIYVVMFFLGCSTSLPEILPWIPGRQTGNFPAWTSEETKDIDGPRQGPSPDIVMFSQTGWLLESAIDEKITTTPWKINMEPTNHPFRKENDLNQTSMIMFHVNLQGWMEIRDFISSNSQIGWQIFPTMMITFLRNNLLFK